MCQGKTYRGPFPSSDSKTTDILQLVHSDLSDMLPVTSLRGYLYYVVFVDDFSRKTWIYFLKKKDEIFSWFRAFKALVENQTGKKIKILRTNNGTKYESNEFNDYCREARIKRETTTTYTPEKNGVVERKNRSIIEATHAMLHDQGLPKFLRGEATNNVVIFGSPIYFHVLKEKGSKLDTFENKGTFVGYIETSKAYKIYVHGKKEVELSHDVTFDEDVALRKISNLPIPRKDKEADARNQGDSQDESMHDVEEPMDPIDPPPHEPSSSKRRPSWLRETLEDAKRHVAPKGTFRESKKLNRYQGYLTAMSTIVQSEPCTFEEVAKHQAWKDAMNEKYESIMENDVWDVVTRSKDKFVVTSKWLFKIKHGVDGSAEKFKAKFVARGFSQKEGLDYDEIFAPVARYTTIRSIIALATSQLWNLH
eukprot:PITA_25599